MATDRQTDRQTDLHTYIRWMDRWMATNKHRFIEKNVGGCVCQGRKSNEGK